MAKQTIRSKGKKPKGARSLLSSIARWTFRSVMAVLTLVVCLVVVMAAYSDYVNPTTLMFPSFLGIAYGIIYVLGLCWLLLTLLLHRWHCAMAMAVALLLGGLSAWRYCPVRLTDGPEPVVQRPDGTARGAIDSLTVLTYNTCIMGQTHLTRINEKIPVIDVVRESGADVVCLQEYAFTLSANGHTEQELRRELSDLYPYYDFMPNDERKALGIAIFSKYPIRKAQRVDKRKKGYFSAMYYQLDYKGRLVAVTNMHLRSNLIQVRDRMLYDEMIDHFEADSLQRIRTGMVHALAQAFRMRSVEANMLAAYLQDYHPEGMPLLVCGDMNDTPVSYCYRRLRKVGLSDTWQEAGSGPGITYREHHFWFRIDHLLHNDGLRALDVRVLRHITHSDHYPVQATYQIL